MKKLLNSVYYGIIRNPFFHIMGMLIAFSATVFAVYASLGNHGDVAWAEGYPDFTTSTGTKSIPWIFSKKVLKKWYPKSIMSYTSNTELA